MNLENVQRVSAALERAGIGSAKTWRCGRQEAAVPDFVGFN
jgi:hypothetical protein